MSLFSLRDVNFNGIIQYPNIDIEEGRVTFICGKSGCGKSTLLKLLNGVLSSTSGRIEYNDKPVERYNPIALRRDVLLCGQSIYLSDKSIKQNFEEFYLYRSEPVPNDYRIKEFLDICHVKFQIDSQCTNMSGGEKQRVYISICLSFMPKVFMMDEPTSALDEVTSNSFLKSITEFSTKNNKTLIVVSHNQSFAKTFGDNLICLERK